MNDSLSNVSSVSNSDRTVQSSEPCLKSDVSDCAGESSVETSSSDEAGWVLKATPAKAKQKRKQSKSREAENKKEDAWVLETETPAVRIAEWWPPQEKRARQGWASPSPTTPRRTVAAQPNYLSSTSNARTRKENIAAQQNRSANTPNVLGSKGFRFGGCHPSASPATPKRAQPPSTISADTPNATPTSATPATPKQRSGSLRAGRRGPGVRSAAQRTATPPTRNPPPPPAARVVSASARQPVRQTGTAPTTPRTAADKVNALRYPLTSQGSSKRTVTPPAKRVKGKIPHEEEPNKVITPRVATRGPGLRPRNNQPEVEKKAVSTATPLRDIKLTNRRTRRNEYLMDSIEQLGSEMREEEKSIKKSKHELEVDKGQGTTRARSPPNREVSPSIDVLRDLNAEDFREAAADAPVKDRVSASRSPSRSTSPSQRSVPSHRSLSSRQQSRSATSYSASPSARAPSEESLPAFEVPNWLMRNEMSGRLAVVRDEGVKWGVLIAKHENDVLIILKARESQERAETSPGDCNTSTDTEAALSLVTAAKQSYHLDAATYMQLVESLERLTCSRDEITERYKHSKQFFTGGSKLANSNYVTGPAVAKRRRDLQQQHDNELHKLRAGHDEYVASEQSLLDSLDPYSEQADQCRERLRRNAGLHYSKLAALRTEHSSKQNALWNGLPSGFCRAKEDLNESQYSAALEELDKASLAVEMLLDGDTIENTSESNSVADPVMLSSVSEHHTFPHSYNVDDPSIESLPPQHSPNPKDHVVSMERERSATASATMLDREPSAEVEYRFEKFVEHEQDERRFLGEEEANSVARILNDMHTALLQLILAKNNESREVPTPSGTLSSNSISSDSDYNEAESPSYAWTNMYPRTDAAAEALHPQQVSSHQPFPSNVMPTLQTIEREPSASVERQSTTPLHTNISPMTETPLSKADLGASSPIFSVSPEMSPDVEPRRSVSSGPSRQPPPPPPPLPRAEGKPRRTRSPSLDGNPVRHGAKDLRGKTPPRAPFVLDERRSVSMLSEENSPAPLSLSPSLCRKDGDAPPMQLWEEGRSPSREPTPPAEFAEYAIGDAETPMSPPKDEDELEATVPANGTPTPKWKQLIDELHHASCGPVREMFDELQEEQGMIRKAHRVALIGKLKAELDAAVEKDKEPLAVSPTPTLLNTYRHRTYRRPRNMASTLSGVSIASASSSQVGSIPVWRTGEGIRGVADTGYATRSPSPPLQHRAFTRSAPGY